MFSLAASPQSQEYCSCFIWQQPSPLLSLIDYYQKKVPLVLQWAPILKLQFKFQGFLTCVTNSESCPSSWNKSLLKEVTEPGMWFHLSVHSFWCKWMCLLETIQLARLSLLTLFDMAVQSSISFSNSLLEQFVFRIVNFIRYIVPATTWKINKKAFCAKGVILKKFHRKDDFPQAYTTCIIQILSTGPTYVKNNIILFGSRLICF